MADIGSLGDGGAVEYEDEVDVVRGPADHEDEHNNSKHLYNLKLKPCKENQYYDDKQI